MGWEADYPSASIRSNVNRPWARSMRTGPFGKFLLEHFDGSGF